eukprot:GHVU01096467.1.p2 GENE.GHVU01096467.1~~GHVU01096467.1.p2  ORF type:complete len:121 (-),score=13.60 GHVU01096467.1:535-897(-)
MREHLETTNSRVVWQPNQTDTDYFLCPSFSRMGVEEGAIEHLNATLFAYISKAEMEEQFEHGNPTASPTSLWNSNDDARRVTLRLLNLAHVYGSAPRSWTEGHQIRVPKSNSSCSPGDLD